MTGFGRRHMYGAIQDVYKLFEKAPQSVWEEVYRSINPLAQMVKKGAERPGSQSHGQKSLRLPETFLERPVTEFLFEDEALAIGAST